MDVGRLSNEQLSRLLEQATQEAHDRGIEAPDILLDTSNFMTYSKGILFADYLGKLHRVRPEFGVIRLRMWELLLRRLGNLVTLEQFQTVVWFDRDNVASRDCLAVHISKMRMWLQPAPYEIQTVWGLGFSLVKTSDDFSPAYEVPNARI